MDYAKKIYTEGFQSAKHMPTELRLVATYMRRNLQYKPKILRQKMYEWCSEHIIGYKREKYYKIINSAINKACKTGSVLLNVDKIEFYDYEMKYISDLQIFEDNKRSPISYDCKKLLFTLLFQMKMNKYIMEAKSNNNNFVYTGKYFQGGQNKYNKLKKLAKIPDRIRINEDLVCTLWINNLVTPMYNGLLRLDFMENIYKLSDSVTDKKVAFEIKDYDSVGWYFDYYNKDTKIRFCKCCGRIFKKSGNRQEYCSDECGANSNRKLTKERMQSRRSG